MRLIIAIKAVYLLLILSEDNKHLTQGYQILVSMAVQSISSFQSHKTHLGAIPQNYTKHFVELTQEINKEYWGYCNPLH
jgi:hypothetical protein